MLYSINVASFKDKQKLMFFSKKAMCFFLVCKFKLNLNGNDESWNNMDSLEGFIWNTQYDAPFISDIFCNMPWDLILGI